MKQGQHVTKKPKQRERESHSELQIRAMGSHLNVHEDLLSLALVDLGNSTGLPWRHDDNNAPYLHLAMATVSISGGPPQALASAS